VNDTDSPTVIELELSVNEVIEGAPTVVPAVTTNWRLEWTVWSSVVFTQTVTVNVPAAVGSQASAATSAELHPVGRPA
jgi:hypothetical protein